MRKQNRSTRAEAVIRASVRGFRGRVALIASGRVLAGALYMIFALVTRALIDCAVAGDMLMVWRNGAILLALALLQTGITFGVRWLDASTQHKAGIRARTELYESILRKKQTALSEYHSAVLLERLSKDVSDMIAFPVTIVPGFIGTLAGLVCAVWALFWMNWLLPAALIAAGLILSGIGRLFQMRVKHNYQNWRSARELTNAYYQETLSNSLMLKVFRAQRQATERAASFEREAYGRWRRWYIFNQTLKHGVGASFQLGYLGALVFCAVLLINGGITFGGMTAILQLVAQIQDPFSSVGELLSAQSIAHASAERLAALNDLPSEPTDAHLDGWQLYGEMDRLQIRGVSFDYGRNTVLSEASAEARKGGFVVVSGQSGAGKSTLIKLLLGVYEDYTGSIDIVKTDGARVKLDVRTRSLFAYVPQEHMVFGGSVRENLAFLCGKVTDEEIWQAARLADAEEFLRSLKHGLDTMLGEQGYGLSEGQAQRIAIARALLARAPILVLDEATSALDEATEARVLENIRALGEITLIIISHRRAAYQICDMEWRITDGKIERRQLIHDR